MVRTTQELVAGIIELDPRISDLSPFITAASLLVDEVDAKSDLASENLQVIETWLAAHFYAIRDPRSLVEKAGSVSQTIESKVDLNLSVTRYGQMAMVLDTSGTLRALSNGRVSLKVTWLGTDPCA